MAFQCFLTNAGRQIQARAQTGIALHFSRLQIGSGVLVGLPTERTMLIAPVAYVDITRLRVNADSTVTVGGKWDNGDIMAGFYFREIGLWATNPDNPESEILYTYAYDSDGAQGIPAGGAENVIEKTINIITAIGNATDVTATISSAAAVTQEDLDSAIATCVPKTRTVNGKDLSADITLSATDVSACDRPLRFTDVVVAPALWLADSTYADYGFRADIPLTGVTAVMVPDVVLPLTVATGGEVAPVALCGVGYVRLYATAAQAAMTIPTITIWKAV